MTRVQLNHPEGKKGITMDADKFETLSDLFLKSLKKNNHASFHTLMESVETDMRKSKKVVEGNLQWNLFWVSLHLESAKQLLRDKKRSPHIYSLP